MAKYYESAGQETFVPTVVGAVEAWAIALEKKLDGDGDDVGGEGEEWADRLLEVFGGGRRVGVFVEVRVIQTEHGLLSFSLSCLRVHGFGRWSVPFPNYLL